MYLPRSQSTVLGLQGDRGWQQRISGTSYCDYGEWETLQNMDVWKLKPQERWEDIWSDSCHRNQSLEEQELGFCVPALEAENLPWFCPCSGLSPQQAAWLLPTLEKAGFLIQSIDLTHLLVTYTHTHIHTEKDTQTDRQTGAEAETETLFCQLSKNPLPESSWHTKSAITMIDAHGCSWRHCWHEDRRGATEVFIEGV